MSRERFPRKKGGDDLSAGHVNRLGRVCERVARRLPGGGTGIQTDSFDSQSPFAKWEQFTFEITNTQINSSDGADSGLYLGRIRTYEFDDENWEIDDDENEYEIDATSLDTTNLGAKFSVGDKVVAYWDPQRGMFVPVHLVGFDRCNAVLKGGISGSGNKTVDAVVATRGASPLTDPTDATEELTVSNNLFEFDGDDDGTCKIEYNLDSGEWEFYQVKCPA